MNNRPEMNPDRMLWFDLETTGVRDPREEAILEVAAVITNNDLQVLGAYEAVIHQEEDVLANMQDGARALHEASGLLDEIEPKGVALHSAEADIIVLLKTYKAEMSPLCGNTIHYDRAFVNTYMKDLAWPNYLHYRNVDVRQLYQMHQRWLPEDAIKLPEFKTTHRALDDIYESIDLARIYKEAFQSAFSTSVKIRKDGYDAATRDASEYVIGVGLDIKGDGEDFTNEQVVNTLDNVAQSIRDEEHKGAFKP